jgi:hypothetical protein
MINPKISTFSSNNQNFKIMRTILLFFFLTFSISGFSQKTKVYEYLTMAQINNDIELTLGGEKHEIIDVKAEKSKDPHDFRPLLLRIRKYEEQGWELVSNTIYSAGGFSCNYVMMRREN